MLDSGITEGTSTADYPRTGPFNSPVQKHFVTKAYFEEALSCRPSHRVFWTDEKEMSGGHAALAAGEHG